MRVILITGANGGLGQAIARNFLSESPDNFVWLGVFVRRENADKLAAEFSNRCRCLELDVTQPDSWKAAVEKILAEHKRIDVLVNNAGKHHDGLLATMPLNTWDSVIKINLDATFYGCQAVMTTMVSQRSGRIINISSLSAILPPPGQTNYAAAKAGVVALTQSLAKEVARLNITVNALCPGFIETDTISGMNPEERKQAQSRIPMRRFGKPEEVAAAVRFLACAEAGYITGSTLKVDGGIL
ncbi:MAG TPA: SDR family NAD(P)-dependent oxidoreductase [Verrucomicrobiae bacterium]|nr:SDR family NAD(P)-dependent oxidoreductase [Verrucomicrobiae bacterium]